MLNESMQQMVADKLLTLKDRFMNQKVCLRCLKLQEATVTMLSTRLQDQSGRVAAVAVV